MGRRRINQCLVQTSTGIWSVTYNAENRPILFTRKEANGTETQIACTYDYMGRRATKKVESNGETTLHQRYLYRGYLQVAACDRTRTGHPGLWLILWDPTQPIATRPLSIQKDGTWYCYGWDLTKNMNGTLASIRRSTMQHPSYPLWQLVKGKRYVLLRGREKIDGDAKDGLRQLSQLNRKPYIAYLHKEQFRQVFQTKDGNTAALRLILWIKMCMQSKVKQLEAFARGISSKFNGVAMGSVTG